MDLTGRVLSGKQSGTQNKDMKLVFFRRKGEVIMFYKIPPISTSYERSEKSLPKSIKMQETKENDNEEEFSDVLIDSMVNSDEYSAVDLANVIMNHCSPEIMLEALKRNIWGKENLLKPRDLVTTLHNKSPENNF